MSAARLEARKIPRQPRSQATVEAIVEAAARVLEAAGPAGFNTNAVARRAGVSVGSLYQYFPGKQALIAELSRRNAEAVLGGLAEVAAQTAGRPVLERLRGFVQFAIAQQSARPKLSRVLDQLEEGLALPTDGGGRRSAAGGAGYDRGRLSGVGSRSDRPGLGRRSGRLSWLGRADDRCAVRLSKWRGRRRLATGLGQILIKKARKGRIVHALLAWMGDEIAPVSPFR